MTRRRKVEVPKGLGGLVLKRRKRVGPTFVMTNRRKHRPRQYNFTDDEGREVAAVTQVATHHGRVSSRYTHRTQTSAGRTRSHPIQTKPARRAASKRARRSRKVNAAR